MTQLFLFRLQRYRAEKKQREKEKKEMEANNRKHLANMRVVQKNLVYVIGLSARVANEEVISVLNRPFVSLIFIAFEAMGILWSIW